LVSYLVLNFLPPPKLRLCWLDSESFFEKCFKLLQPASDLRNGVVPPLFSSRHLTSSPSHKGNLPCSWKLACVLRDRSGSLLMGCRLCGQLDVFTQHMKEVESWPTQLRTWQVPCLCPSLVHRRCLESQLGLRGPNRTCLGKRCWISYDSPWEEVRKNE